MAASTSINYELLSDAVGRVEELYPGFTIDYMQSLNGDYLEVTVRKRGSYHAHMLRLTNTFLVTSTMSQIADIIASGVKMISSPDTPKDSFQEKSNKDPGDGWVDEWIKKNASNS